MTENLKQDIAIYVAQNEAVVVVVELFEPGKFFVGHPGYFIYVIHFSYLIFHSFIVLRLLCYA